MKRFRRRLNAMIGHQVVVHTRDGRSVQGVLVGVWADAIELRAAAVLIHSGDRVPLDGQTLVPVERVEWYQALPPAAAHTLVLPAEVPA